MFKKILVLCLGLASFSNVWADEFDELRDKYFNLDYESQTNIKKNLMEKQWIFSSISNEFAAYVNYNYVNQPSSGITKAWVKQVVVKDLQKDGLNVGDFSMYYVEYNCTERTYRNISYTDYNKNTGAVIDSYTFPSYRDFKPVIPNSVGESQFNAICLMSDMKAH